MYVKPNLPIPPTQSLFSPCCPYICSLCLCLYSCFANKIKGGRLRWCTSTAKRSYPTSKVRDRSREDPMPEGRWPRGTTPRRRSGAAAGRSYPMPEVRGGGQEEQAQVQGAVTARAQEGLEELFHVQGQERWW